MAATLWFHRSNGDDLLVNLHISQVYGFINHIHDTGADRGLFQDAPLVNHAFFANGQSLEVPENETDVFSDANLQVILAPDGFQPPSYSYSKIFLVTMEAAVYILTGLPWSHFTKEEIMAEMDPYLHPAVEKGDGFSRAILAATRAQMEPKIIDIQSMEHYIFLVTAPGRRFKLMPREEPYDVTEPWKTEKQLDAELENYMSTA